MHCLFIQILTILLFPAILLILIKKHYEVTVTKKLFEKLKNKFINFCKWVWSECKDWHTLVLFAIVVVLMYAPVWLGYNFTGARKIVTPIALMIPAKVRTRKFRRSKSDKDSFMISRLLCCV